LLDPFQENAWSELGEPKRINKHEQVGEINKGERRLAPTQDL
jgi:hypothetical protein